jgi:tetratricopeptide (TPR) repeat protein
MIFKLLFRSTFAAMLVVSFCVFASAQTREEVEAQNKKITEDNATIVRTFTAGNAALMANQLDEAIAAYREGLAVRPDEPALLSNLSEALRRRGTNTYNETLKNVDALMKGGKDAAAKDWLEAAEASRQALRIINRAGVDPQQQGAYAQNKLTTLSTRALAMRLVATKVDQTQAQAAWDAYQQFIAVELDPEKKSRLKTDALQMLYEAGELDMAIAQARISLAHDPANLATNRILGMALASSGDQSKYAEAVKYLQIYLAKAPDSDPLKQPARDVLGFIETQVPVPARRKGRSTRRKG